MRKNRLYAFCHEENRYYYQPDLFTLCDFIAARSAAGEHCIPVEVDNGQVIDDGNRRTGLELLFVSRRAAARWCCADETVVKVYGGYKIMDAADALVWELQK